MPGFNRGAGVYRAVVRSGTSRWFHEAEASGQSLDYARPNGERRSRRNVHHSNAVQAFTRSDDRRSPVPISVKCGADFITRKAAGHIGALPQLVDAGFGSTNSSGTPPGGSMTGKRLAFRRPPLTLGTPCQRRIGSSRCVPSRNSIRSSQRFHRAASTRNTITEGGELRRPEVEAKWSPRLSRTHRHFSHTVTTTQPGCALCCAWRLVTSPRGWKAKVADHLDARRLSLSYGVEAERFTSSLPPGACWSVRRVMVARKAGTDESPLTDAPPPPEGAVRVRLPVGSAAAASSRSARAGTTSCPGRRQTG